MEKNRFHSEEGLWTAPGAVTCGREAGKEEKRAAVTPCAPAPREEASERCWRYLYLEEEEEKEK